MRSQLEYLQLQTPYRPPLLPRGHCEDPGVVVRAALPRRHPERHQHPVNSTLPIAAKVVMKAGV